MQKHDGDDDLGVWSEFGTQAGILAGEAGARLGETGGVGDGDGDGVGVGDRGGSGGADVAGGGGGSVGERSGIGDKPDMDGFGDAPLFGGVGAAVSEVAALAPPALTPPAGYRNKVDADGDGVEEKATYRGRRDGGADILVDVDGDGRTDFIGADVDLDNRVDYADYDKNGDGVFEKRMYDDDGDGYLDRTVWT